MGPFRIVQPPALKQCRCNRAVVLIAGMADTIQTSGGGRYFVTGLHETMIRLTVGVPAAVLTSIAGINASARPDMRIMAATDGMPSHSFGGWKVQRSQGVDRSSDQCSMETGKLQSGVRRY
jgi:hypothetical protein